MWGVFAVSVLVAASVLFIPGYFLMRITHLEVTARLACSPLLSVFLLFFASVAFACMDIQSGWLPVVSFSLIVALVASFVLEKPRLLTAASLKAGFRENLNALIYVAFAVAIASLYFLRNLDGPGSVFQENDCYTHLDFVRGFFNAGVYFDKGAGAYPLGWHCVTALVMSIADTDIGIAVNAVNFVFIALIFPLGVHSFLSMVLEGNNEALRWGALCSVAFTAFPWGFLVFGPLYPNLAGYSMVPAAMTLFISLFCKTTSFSNRMKLTVLLLCSGLALVFLHPNAVFVGIVIGVPYCMHLIRQSFGSRTPRGILYLGAFFGVVFAFWTACFLSPVFAGIVWFNWDSYLSPVQALLNSLMLALTKTSAPQFVLSAIVFVGIAYSFAKKRYRWASATYLFLIVVYIINTSTEGFLKHYLTGFWYTDTFRIAAMMAIAAIPLASIGLAAVAKLCKKLIALLANDGRGDAGATIMGAMAIAFCVAVFCPSYEIPKNTFIVTGFGSLNQMLGEGNSLAKNAQCYDGEEGQFAGKVQQTVGSESLILNIPFDGSIYAYGFNNINTYFRGWYGYGDEGECVEAELIRKGLCDIASDEDVRDAVDSIGAKYVLLFDQNNNQGLSWLYDSEQWLGISLITDETPGFKVILAEGDMRLYEIML